MKTKQITKYLLAAAVVGLIFTGCKKKDTTVTPVTPVDDAAQQTITASDQTRVDNESNQSMDDCNSTLQGVSTTRGMESFPCGVTVDTTNKATGLIVLNFNGNNCAGTKSRTGSISIQLPYVNSIVTKWHTAGCKVTLTFTNYKVTTLSDNKSLTFNGTHSITNVNGGLMMNITAGNPIVHKIRANMQLTFDDGTNRTWGAARLRTFTIANNIVSEQIAGDTTVGTYANTVVWGTNRAGEAFDVTIPTPVVENVFGGTCLYKPFSGVRVLNGIAHVVTLTYGVDANGNADTSPCTYGWKANWTNAQGVAKQVIRSY